MLHTNTVDDVVMALAAAPVDSRTGNRTLYSVDWLADVPTMIGKVNEDWVRRELDWFVLGSNDLADMEPPVPTIFQNIAGSDGRVNSAYGYILFNPEASRAPTSLYDRVLSSFEYKGYGTRHGVAVISDRDVHLLNDAIGGKDFICTNALNFMIDDSNSLHIIAQMRSMDAVFGYRADWSMWDRVMDMLVADLNDGALNLHIYPRHFELLEAVAQDTDERLQRQVWRGPESLR
jgi:hypothetical protein